MENIRHRLIKTKHNIYLTHVYLVYERYALVNMYINAEIGTI